MKSSLETSRIYQNIYSAIIEFKAGCREYLSVMPLIIAGFFISGSVQAEKIKLYTEELSPLSYSLNGQAAGCSPEVVREMLKRANIDASIRVVPWPRAYKETLNEKNVGLFGAARTKEREASFLWVGPIASIEDAIYARQDSSIFISSLEEAKKAKSILALRNGYTYQQLDAAGFKNLIQIEDPNKIMAMVIANRAPLVVTTSIAVGDALAKIGEPPTALKKLFTVAKADTYLIFSTSSDKELVDKLQHALDGMKADGSFQKIYKKWFPLDTPPM